MMEDDTSEASGAVSRQGKRGSKGRVLAGAVVIIGLLVLATGAYLAATAPGSPGRDGGDTIAIPGHPDWYRKTLDVFYENGTRISLVENRNARDPEYGRLISFLMDDPTERGVYRPGYGCSGFAADLHDRAEMCNIKAHVVLVSLSNAPLHMVVMFNTTDTGAVYVDDTGLTQAEIDRDVLIADRTVNLTLGAPYLRHFLPPFDFDEDPGMGTVVDISIIS
jgi:hypothetical protein